jgi:lipoprotein-releasing system permease protein
MTGLNKMLDSLILNRTPHIRLYNEIKPNNNQPVNIAKDYKNNYNIIRSIKSTGSRQEIYNSGAIIKTVANDKRIAGIAPKISTQVFFNNGTTDIAGIVYGIDIQAETRLFHFADYVTSGNAIDLKNIANSIVLGKGLADRLLAGIGDVVLVTTSKGETFPLKVVGYFQSGVGEFDKTQSFASIATTQKLLNKPANYVTDIQIKLNDIKQAPAVAKEYAALYGADAEDIQTANAQFETGTVIRTLISYTVGITLLIVAGFGIYNILNMMIYEKMDSIAILKATGFSGRDVKLIFLLISLTIGFFGGLVGLLFGFLLSVLIDQIPFITPALPTVTTFPVNYDPMFYFIAVSFSLITTYFAGFFPARKASKIDPVIIIRGK